MEERERVKKAEAICKKLLKLNKEIESLGLSAYLANDTLNLMNGPHHDYKDRPLQENVITSVTLTGWDGGDW